MERGDGREGRKREAEDRGERYEEWKMELEIRKVDG